jgi:hypothetical protein
MIGSVGPVFDSFTVDIDIKPPGPKAFCPNLLISFTMTLFPLDG